MKWYSIKKYKPPTGSWLICRVWHRDGWDEYVTARYMNDSYWDYGVFFDCSEEEYIKITHFCIPDPVEIEE